jgi:nucleoside-diphosphate-sugar epimerase
MRRKPDILLAQALLDWQPIIDVRRGLTMTIEDAMARQHELLEPARHAVQG